MSYQASSQSAPAHVPAWKRLGLKLKGSSDGGSAATTATASSTGAAQPPRPPPQPQTRPFSSSDRPTAYTPMKRKEPPASALASSATKRSKSVSFAEGSGTGVDAAEVALKKKKASKKKKAKKAAKKAEKTAADSADQPAPNLARELEYLQQWQASRDTWKFNKNHQQLLVKYVFVGGAATMPSTHMPIFYDYIRDMQGATRTRLRDAARQLCRADDDGDDKTSAKDSDKDAETYTEVVATFRDRAGRHAGRIDETAYAERFAMNVALQKRLVTRIRAENVAAELAGDDDAEASAAGAASKATAAPAARVTTATVAATATRTLSAPAVDPRTQLNSGRKPTRERKSKKRALAADSSDSSDESDADSDSDTSSSGGSSPSDDDSDSD